MNTIIAEFVLCFAVAYLLEGIDKAIHNKANNIYEALHIVCPLYTVGAMVYFLLAGVIK